MMCKVARSDRVEIIVPLGAGGMNKFYRTRDTRLDRTVAFKRCCIHDRNCIC